MASVRHLSKAPIVEAIVDLRVKAAPGLDARSLEAVHGQIKDRFPKLERFQVQQALFSLSPASRPEVVTTELGLQGFVFKSEDEREIAQFRVDGFTFSRLKQYTSWREVVDAALDLWKRYISLASPLAVTRVALRYVNRIQLGDLPLDQYLTVGPRIPPGLPDVVTGFLNRMFIADRNTDRHAIITQVLEPRVSNAPQNLLLDIDVYNEFKDAAATSLDFNGIVKSLDRLHDFKNQVFFASLTEQVIKGFE